MPLKYMYATNKVSLAKVADDCGVDRIFIDLETVGKQARQGGMDTLQSHHTVADIAAVKQAVCRAEVLVRVNPIYPNSKSEIDAAIANGADILMLPYFKTLDEVKAFLKYVGGRVQTMLLVETEGAVAALDDILALGGIDAVHIGINDLHLERKKRFMFELVADGTVEALCRTCKKRGISYGFGGVAALGQGLLPAEYIIAEHYRIGSRTVILSRSFFNPDREPDTEEAHERFRTEFKKLRVFEEKASHYTPQQFAENFQKLQAVVNRIVEG